MGTCEVCGNSCDKAFPVSVAGGAAHCARHEGEKTLRGRA